MDKVVTLCVFVTALENKMRKIYVGREIAFFTSVILVKLHIKDEINPKKTIFRLHECISKISGG